MRETKKKKSVLKISVIVVLVIIQIVVVYIVARWLMDNYNNKKLNEYVMDTVYVEIEEEIFEYAEDGTLIASDGEVYYQSTNVVIDFDKLFEINSDAVGWIKINNTNINYGIVQTTDNSYYLKRALDKSYNSAGSIFMDYRNNPNFSDKNTVIYGHNMLSSAMFSDVIDIVDNKISANKIYIYTEEGTLEYQIFSTYEVDIESYYIKTQMSTETYIEFLETVSGRSNKDYGVAVNENDKILTLSTCADDDTKRAVVHAKLIK